MPADPPNEGGQQAAQAPIFTSNVPVPPQIELSGNLANNWKQWKQVWSAYELVMRLNEQTNEYRVAAFITCIGPKALAIHNGLPFQSEDEKKNLAKILELWESYCLGKTNIIYERYRFNNRNQEAGESIDTYPSNLRCLSDTCNFGALKDEMIRDRIVCGVRDGSLRKKLLQVPELTLQKCIDMCRSAEATSTQLEAMSAQTSHVAPPPEVNFVKTPSKGADKSPVVKDCRFCGQTHEMERSKCPAFGKICSVCQRQNHFALKCYHKKKPRETRKPPRKHSVNQFDCDESEEEILSVSCSEEEINTVDNHTNKIVATMKVGGKDVKMLIDSGASCNVLPINYLPKGTVVEKSSHTLKMYSKSTMSAVGEAKVSLVNPKNVESYLIDFTIVDGNFAPLLGLETAQKMKLLVVQTQNILSIREDTLSFDAEKPKFTRDTVISEYPDVFGEELGRREGKVHLETDPNVAPTVMPPRRVPVALKEKLKNELDGLTQRKVISPTQEPTDWVSSMIAAKKPDGNIRLCIDPHYLNPALKRSHYPLPIIEEILPELSKAKVFSKVDLKEGFLQAELDEESSRLTVFQTSWGRYRFHRMPFGITPAPEIFQMKLDQNLEGLKGVFKIADDILITGQGETEREADEDHDRNLKSLLDRCRERNIKLNKKKFTFKCNDVQFIGHRLTKEGLKPDPAKVKAILSMKKPDDIAAVQRLMGMVKYLSKFLADLSQICEPIRRLTHKDEPWLWTKEQDVAFDKIKEAVTSAPVLKYFDSSKPTEGSGDASSQGLGFVLTQEDHPVTYANRALTQAEQRYSQIEKELFALVFGLEHNHQYVYGRKVILYTDHKSLVSISSKLLAAAPKRLQRLLLCLQSMTQKSDIGLEERCISPLPYQEPISAKVLLTHRDQRLRKK